MAGADRLAIFPSRANHVLVKQRVEAAQRGANLLKRKRDAIDMKLRELRHEIEDRKDIADDILREAIFTFAKANFLNTDFNIMRVERCAHAEAYVVKRTQKVVGISLPHLELIIRSDISYPLTGLARGGGQVSHIRINFQEALKNLVSVASLNFSLQVLTVASRQNNMRVNALTYVLIPRLQNTVSYIGNELEEFEREDFYRLKKSQTKQMKAKLAFSQLIKAKNAAIEKRKSSVVHHAGQIFERDHFEKGRVVKRNRKTGREVILANLRRKETELDPEREKPKRTRKKKHNKDTDSEDNDSNVDSEEDTKKKKVKDKVQINDEDKIIAKRPRDRFEEKNNKQRESANQTEMEADQSTQTDEMIFKTLKH